MSSFYREQEAKAAAADICKFLKIPMDSKFPIGLILGTGWGDALDLKDRRVVSFSSLRGFMDLGDLKGHARNVITGNIAGKRVIALQGRVHLNEGHGEEIAEMVRLQTEMLIKLGVKTLIVTSAVGSMTTKLPVGSIAVVKSFITVFAPPMPMWAGEFYVPEDMLDESLNEIAMLACHDSGLNYSPANHVMLRGPFFEGRKNDKRILKETGADVVGMSMLPEACVASIFGVKVIGLGFVSNDDVETHSHEENMARANKSREKLGALLASLIKNI